MAMQKNHTAENYIKQLRQKRVLKRVIAMLSVLVILVTFNSTKFTADTLERIADCGYDYDHQHGPECFDASGDLVCRSHVHTDACYQTRPVRDSEALVVEAAELPVEAVASLPLEEVASEPQEEVVEEVEFQLGEDAEEALGIEAEAAGMENLDDALAPEAQLLYYVGEQIRSS